MKASLVTALTEIALKKGITLEAVFNQAAHNYIAAHNDPHRNRRTKSLNSSEMAPVDSVQG